MEAEAFPVRFTRGVRGWYWRRRRKYHRLEAGDKGATSRGRQQKLLGGRGAGGWGRLRVRVVRALTAAPRRALARARDAYVGGMLALARKAASAVALPGAGPRVPRRNKQLPPAAGRPTEFEQRLILEIYKSIVASKELTTMLQYSSSTAHRQTTPGGPAQQMVHLLDM